MIKVMVFLKNAYIFSKGYPFGLRELGYCSDYNQFDPKMSSI